jgi:autotransporter-associated beta strand protein
MNAYGVIAGDIWSIYWFPGISAANGIIRSGQSFGSFQSSALDQVAIGYGADTAMVFPADGTPLATTLYFDSATEATSSPTPEQFTATQKAAAVPFSWDTDGVTAGAQGGAGIWDTTTAHWRMNSLNSTWTNSGTDNEAIFGATAGTVTIAAGGVTANDLAFNTTGYTITGDTLTLNGTTPTVTTAAGVTALISSQILGNVGLTKEGDGILVLGGANTYTGTTQVNAGTLAVNGSLTGSAVQVADGARLGGIGTISGAGTTFANGGIHSPGNSVGVQTVADVTYSSGSIFEWELGSSPATTGRGTNYDGVNVTGTMTAPTDAIFRVVLDGSQTFGGEFWNTARTWSDIFTTGDGTTAIEDWADVFSRGFEYYNYGGVGGTLLALGAPSSEGSFTMSGSSLSWSPVPEISNALIGGLIGIGLLRRRRDE